MLRGKSFAAVGVFCVLCAASAARAAIITLSFSGTVSDPVDYSSMGYVPAAIQSGDSYVGTVSFNNDATASSSDATDADYSGVDLDMTVNILVDGKYQYTDTTASSSDEIDLESSGFNLFKRGPTVYTSFSPNPPFSHLDFSVVTDTDVLADLTAADLSINQFSDSGVSDAQTSGADYYYVGATLASVGAVPEPGCISMIIVAATAALMRRRRSLQYGN